MSKAPPQESLPEVPGYRVERVLGHGGFGIVVAARAGDGSPAALKIATAGDAVAAAHLAREERALRAVGPAVAPAVLASAALPAARPTWLSSCWSPDARERLREANGPLERGELATFGAALCDAVGAVHASGYLHLDLKPDNAFLTRGGGVRLIDFGLARPIRERQDRGAAFGGTAEYASPEQCESAPTSTCARTYTRSAWSCSRW